MVPLRQLIARLDLIFARRCGRLGDFSIEMISDENELSRVSCCRINQDRDKSIRSLYGTTESATYRPMVPRSLRNAHTLLLAPYHVIDGLSRAHRRYAMYCTKCGNEISDENSFCGKCGAKAVDSSLGGPSSNPNPSARFGAHDPPYTPTRVLNGIIRLSARNTRIAILAVFGTLLMFLLLTLMLAIGDKLGRPEPGAVFVTVAALLSLASFIALMIPKYAEPFNARASTSKIIDPSTGKPFRLLWWFRWLTGMLALFLLAGISDFYTSTAAPTNSESTEAGVPSAVSEHLENVHLALLAYCTEGRAAGYPNDDSQVHHRAVVRVEEENPGRHPECRDPRNIVNGECLVWGDDLVNGLMQKITPGCALNHSCAQPEQWCASLF